MTGDPYAHLKNNAWADRITVGNAVQWQPPQPFTYIRTKLDAQ